MAEGSVDVHRAGGQPDQTGNGHKGVQAYRWVVSVGMAVIMALSWRVLDQIDKMAIKLDTLQTQVTTLSGTTEGRLNIHAQRHDNADRLNERQDQAISELQRRVWQWLGRQPPSDEQQQRQEWQRR